MGASPVTRKEQALKAPGDRISECECIGKLMPLD
jgi:hypothetical protein